ncbi:sensor histidine kinase [Jatrophihabitans fulvus]
MTAHRHASDADFGILPSDSLRRVLPVDPLWWRVPMWAVMTGITVAGAHGLVLRIAAGVLMGAGSVALQFVRHDGATVRAVALSAATGLGLAACFTSHTGVAEVLVLVAVARAPAAFEGRALSWFTGLSAAGFGVAIAVIADSWFGLFAAAGVPLLVQRSVDQRDLVRERDRATALLVEAQAAREAAEQAAALQERGRIAREMHDVLAHSLAGLSVQLQAARAVAAREGAGPEILAPLDTAATLAREGLQEARAAVGTLRDPAGLDLDALPALVARQPGDVRLQVEGSPGSVGAEAGHAVYRTVQEALTNAVRHAPGAAVTVRLDWRDDRLVVDVLDSGRTRDAVGSVGAGTGLGLAGMSERIAAAGGTVEAGPHGTGWRVRASVPRVVA